MLPKNHREKIRLRKQNIGDYLRKQNLGRILDKTVNFPKGVLIKDIDQAVMEWVEKDLYLTFENKVIPTFKLFSNQRISEFAQTWDKTDSLGNIAINFKAVSRDSNTVKHGEIFNVPGDPDYTIGYKPVLQENGEEAYDLYTMKQPTSIEATYTITIATNKYELLNKMHELMQLQFTGFQKYIFPNGHAMPLILDEVSDESENEIDDRKYYAQSYKLTLKGYIVDPSGFKITHLPSHFNIITNLKNKNRKKEKEVKVKIEDWSILDECYEEEKSPYENQQVNVIIDFPSCHKIVDFKIDMDLIIQEIELTNIHDFVLYLNEEEQDLETTDYDIKIYNGDDVHIEIERDDPFKDSQIIIKCINPNVIFDSLNDPELSLDEKDFDIDIKTMLN